MALTLTRFNDLRSAQDEEEEKKKKTSGSDRLKAAMEEGSVPQPTKEPETKTPETAKTSGSARLQAAMSKPAKNSATKDATPQISNDYREIDTEKGRIRTRPADLSTPNWQDDPEELEREVKGKSSALKLTGGALSMANAAYQAAGAKKKAAEDQMELYNKSMAKYQGILEDDKASAQDKLTAKKQLSALAPYQRQALTNAQQAGADYAKAENALNYGKTQFSAQQTGLKQDQEALTRRWGLGDSKAAEYEKQAEELRKEADKLYRSGQATSSTLRLAESAEASALKERENYAKYLYATQGEEKAMKYASGAEEGNRQKREAASFGEKVLNTLGGGAANFFSGIAGAPMILISRLMELPDDALYAITGNEAFNLDREPYLRNSKALEASDPFRETAGELKERAGKLGGMVIDTAYAAGNMMGVGGLTGQVTGALANTGLMTKLTSIAESSPLLTSPAARRGAQMAVNALRNPGNLGVSLSSGVNSYSEALANGASFSQAMANGLWKGLTEYVSNRMFSGTPLEDLPGEKGYVTKAIEHIADKLGKSDALRALNQQSGGKVLNWFFNKTGEGLEEVITGVFDPIIDRITYDTEAEWLPKLDALTDEFLGGVLLSLLMTGGEAAITGTINLSTDRKITEYLVENWGIEQAEARKYAPQIRKALKGTQDAAAAVRQAETPAQNKQTMTEAPVAPETTLVPALQAAVNKLTAGEQLTKNDGRRILQDGAAMQTLIDAGLITGQEANDSEGRQRIVSAVEQYAAQVAENRVQEQPTLQLPTPPTPAQTQQGDVDTAPALPVPQNAPQAPVAAETKRPPEPPAGLVLPTNNAPQELTSAQEQGIVEKKPIDRGKGIKVFRGYNRSNVGTEKNLASIRTVSDVIGKGKNGPSLLPFVYYTESETDANKYANQEKTFFEEVLIPSAEQDYKRLVMNGDNPGDKEAWVNKHALEAYEVLTGMQYGNSGNVKEHTIHPKNTLDLSSLGEKASIDDIYRTLSDITGASESDIDDALVLSDLTTDDDLIDVFRLLRNESAGDGVGSRFFQFMKKHGYDAAKYAESGTNHYAVVADTAPKPKPTIALPTAEETIAPEPAKMETLTGAERLNAALEARQGEEAQGSQTPAAQQTAPQTAQTTETPGSRTIQKALAQQRAKEAGKAQSLRDSGFTAASEDATVKIRAEESWDAEEKAVGQALRDLGYEPTFTTGIIHNAEGDSVPFLLESNKLAIRADHRSQSIQTLAEQAIGRGLNIDAGARNQAMEDINRAREARRAQAAEENKPKVSARAQAAMDSARAAGASEEAGALAGRLADIIGRDIRFFNEAGKNGAWKNGYTRDGVIYVNAQAKKTVAWVVGHELTHNVEHSKIYDSLKKLAKKDMGLNWGLRVQSRLDASARIAQKLGDDSVRLTDPADAEREIVADFFADRLLTDEASIRAVCEYEPVTARSIRDYIKNLLRKLGGKESTLERAVTLYNKALKDVAAKAQANAEGRLRIRGTEAQKQESGLRLGGRQYSVDDTDTYNRTALVTEDTVDKWIKDYAAKSSPKYAQAYITRMTPKQFVDLTTSTTGRLLIGDQTEALNAEKLIEATREQPLQIRISDGEVIGHEGRHRATALSRAGVESIPVLVFDSSNKYSKTDVREMTLQGQDFGHSRSYATETLRDLIPLSYENRDRIVQEYGTQPATERLREKYNGRKTIQFSAEDSDDEYRQAPGTPALEKLGIRLAGSKGQYHLAEQLLERDKAAKEMMKATKKAERKLKATAKEREFAAGIAAGIYEEREIPSSMNKNTVTTLADYYAAEEGFKTNMLAEVRGRINAEYQDEAEELLADVENFKKLSMLSLNERTPDRTFRAMFGPKQGKAIFDWLIRPVQMNEAAKTRWHQEQLDKVRKFEDSKGKTRKLTRAESELTMLVMEGKAAEAAVADMEEKGLDAKGIRNAAENIHNGEDAADAAWEFGLKDKEREIAKNYARWMDTQEKLKNADSTIIENAAEAYSKIFDEFYDGINDFLAAHGYEPIGYIKGYAPHMQPEETQSLLEKAFDKMGISLGNDKAQGLPASIAGETAYFKPNKRWDPYFLHRTGTLAEYDIEKAYQSYVGYLSDILFHTDDIMRVRNMERMIRKNSAPDDISETIDHIREIRSAPSEDRLSLLRDAGRVGKTTMLSPAEISEKLDEWEDEQFNALKEDRNYNNLVMWLSNYANILAGKQSFADRGWEYSLGRNSLNFANRLQAAFQRSLVAGSLTSALNQTAQLPLIKAELGDRWYYAALKDILTGQTKGFWKDSDFLTGKHGVDMLYTDNYDKFINGLFKPSTIVDNIVSTTAVRGAFLKAVHQGQSYSEAMQTADDFGRKVMGSREKGTRPLAYESKGLFSRMIHMFQVEAANSWDHIASDLPYEIKEIARTKGKETAARALAGLILRGLLSTFLLNRMTEELYGGTPAPFDVIGLTMNFVASGQGMTTNQYLKTIIDNGLEKIGTDRLFGTEDVDTEFDVGKGLEELGYNVMNDVPLLRNLAGVLGLGDQTVPLPGAGGEFADAFTAAGDLIKEGADGQTIENMIRAAVKLGAQFAPAGRQIAKTAEGVEAAIRGGSYNKKGNLQYPIDTTTDKVRAILFGKNATNAAQEHWASGEGTMSEKQTGMVAKLRGQGMTGAKAQDAARTVKSFSGDDKRDQTMAYIDSLDITDSLKDEMYFYAGYKESTLDNTPWHNKGGNSGRGKTYSMAGLRLRTPERRAPISSGLKLPGTPQARTGTGGLRTK